ncbi:ABC transporter permease [Clostridium sp. Cult2]|uniref:ABC transporter permease n=1 Tax=Clostridium sp. Cult2 TaxID=2079003 RepID=UPI001F3E619D|nr:ABC transporter permease [Clostridium sp. Cult2]MCF6464385.1 peptide ABC transporter permease [Clostridium sp. Cult2]
MKKYILKRLIAIPIILFILSILIFSLVLFLSPSQRVAVFVSAPEDLQNVSMDELIKRYGLDQPFHIQYINWLKGVLNGELGWSNSARMPVAEALRLRIPATIELMILGQLIVSFSGFFLGTLAAKNHNSFIDVFIRIMTIVGDSIPSFVIGLFLLIIFYVKYDIFSPGRLSLFALDIVHSDQFVTYTGMYLIDSLLNWRLDIFLDALKHIILPSIAYSLGSMSTSVRLMRSSLLENMNKGYVDTAITKGVPEKMVLNKHVRRNALIPFITLTGMQIPKLLGGSVIIETIFNYPGMGTFIITSALGLDFPAIIGSSIAVSIMIMISNLIVDLLYCALNPVMRLE